jgi:argininosuccinate lyase
MTDVMRLLRVNEDEMLKHAGGAFVSATPLMEWIARSYALPLRKAKMLMEKAVKYSEKEGEGKVSFRSLKRAMGEMKIDLSISKQDVERIQRPERILTETGSTGTPSEKRVRENISCLGERVKANRDWLIQMRMKIEKSKGLVSKMERQLLSNK